MSRGLTFRGQCEDCGSVSVQISDMVVELYGGSSADMYRFNCPQCGVLVRDVAQPLLKGLLLKYGASNIHPEEELSGLLEALDDESESGLAAIWDELDSD